MIKEAVGKEKIAISSSFFVGDTERDIATGYNFDLKTIAVLSGYSTRRSIKKWKIQPDFIVNDLLAAAKEIILKQGV